MRAAPRSASIPSILGCCALVLGIASTAGAQYRFDVWTSDNGLPQNSINAILQTSDGYLWLATNGGLVRYDGLRFTVFNTANSKGLADNSINALCEDARGDLWLGTEEGLVRKRGASFTTYTTANGLPINQVFDVQVDDNGRLLVCTKRGFICRDNDQFIDCGGRDNQSEPSINNVLRGSAFSVTDGRLSLLSRGQLFQVTLPDALPKTGLRSVYRDREGGIWIATLLAVSRLKDGMLTTYTTRDGLPQSNIVAYCEDRLGNLWLGTGAGGLVKFKDGKFITFTTADGLSGNAIRRIYEDREGTLWVGTNGFGLNRLETPVIKSYSERDGLFGKEAYPICQDQSGAIWIGVGGLHKYQDGRFTRYPMNQTEFARNRHLAYDTASSLCEDEGGIWIANAGAVFYLKNGTMLTKDIVGIPAMVYVIYKDRSGSLWAGTSAGLVRNRDGVRTIYTTSDGLAGDDIKAILEDRQGSLWVGTYGGLSRFEDGKFTSYAETDGLASRRIRSLYEDKNGALWIGTYDGGLSRFKDGRFTKCTAEDGLFDNGVFQILEDDSGNFWISCNRGIYRVSRRQLEDFADGKLRKITCIAYGKADGMIATECNGGRQPAGIRARDGKLWFPTMDGVAVVDPGLLVPNEDPPPLRIEAAEIDHNEVDLERGIEVRPGHYNLEIQYTALSFIKSDYISFKYKLDGLDENWVDAGTRRVAYYSFLPPGKYTFRVIAANSDGIWNTTGASINVTVVPPFWRTWWFSALVVIAAAGMALIFYERRVSGLRRAQALQEAFSRTLIESQESERKRIAAELHDSIGQSLLVIKNQAMLGQTDADDAAAAREQFDEISSTAGGAIEEVRSIAHNLRPYQLDRLGLTMAIKSIVNKVSESSAIVFRSDIDNIDRLLSPEAEINLYRVVQESTNNIIKHSRATEGRIVIERGKDLIGVSIEDNGQGFDANGSATDSPSAGFGLIGIAERARMLGGKCSIRSARGRGTKIDIKIPLDGADRSSDSRPEFIAPTKAVGHEAE
jgi:signal transduction histidine kinase/ligand-binding sensor domain-containing protein